MLLSLMGGKFSNYSFFFQDKKSFRIISLTCSKSCRDIWRMWKMTQGAVRDKFSDVHTRMMKKNYAVVPQWWFHTILILTVALAIYACEGFDKQLQLPWWGLLLSCAIALFFTLPIGIIQATTNQVSIQKFSSFCLVSLLKKKKKC